MNQLSEEQQARHLLVQIRALVDSILAPGKTRATVSLRAELIEEFYKFVVANAASAAPVVDEDRLARTLQAEAELAAEHPHDGYDCGGTCAFHNPALRFPAAAATAAPQTKSCGFCGKSDQEVKMLIQAPVGYICDECVAVCASIIERNAAPVEQSGDERLIALLLDWRKWYSEDLFTPWTTEEAQRVHSEFPGAVDRISADSARGTIDNIIKDIRAGKHLDHE